ncbi:DUF2235 domain-containing protein [Pseudomonas sp. SWRI100]|uniref:T6SS phospholipase effector Tle1-like catalytic domain-containing protein n=1 Tax=Pseudomonas TaxID=286 RepID=UPI0016491C20|nr:MULTISPECIES: DUF2235 domain-containing protein [Pseudomonas]MBC3489219.1 DUF2235 domain-containing protein [Pseudomonas sp. SWRI50]MBC3499265.1 DUF2235 domain-containing protein [Pseudomonas sp. SWRI67]MBV4528007.1 DUF2235 domain-containing protein [Pseudomonas kermanshahensis]
MMQTHRSTFDTPAPTTLRVGVFFDGTGNNLGNATAAGQASGPLAGTSYGNAWSNVALLHALYPAPGSPAPGTMAFLKLYVEGIGTTAGAADSSFASATGRGRTGVEARVAEAVTMIADQLRGWCLAYPQSRLARVELDLFGFSRGAAAARHLANVLRDDASNLLGTSCAVGINFIGLFDTVAAIVAPLQGDFDPADARHGGLRLGLGKAIARHVVQLVAGDERRHNFPLVRSEGDIVVPGVHSNIGGGYLPCMQEQVLLCKPQSQRVPVRTKAECTRAYSAASALLTSAFAELGEPRPRVLTWEQPIAGGKPDEAQKQVYAAVYRERDVAGHLSRVYLSIMRELAVRGGVPFAELGDDEAHRLPDDLLDISRKLHGFALGSRPDAGLTEDEQRLLRDKYIHTSAHWNPVKGLRNSTLDVLFVNRPGEAGRVEHADPMV